MDTTLIINPGSSSKKYALMRDGSLCAELVYEKTTDGFERCVEINTTRQKCETVTDRTYTHALRTTIDFFKREHLIHDSNEIKKIGIRIVAPGTFFTTHRVVDPTYLEKLESVRDSAPLHIPHQLEEIAVLLDLFSHAQIIGVSDSAFHSTIPDESRWYSVPKQEAEKFDLYRFGYHGVSVASVVRQVEKELGSVPEKTIVCHVGSGVSVTALRNGHSIANSMGFAPTSGLMMGTRAGDTDPSALLYLFSQYDGEHVEHMVTEEGGLKGVLGNSDLRVALDRATRNDHDARTAVSMYVAGIRKAIGAYTALLGGVDAFVLTGTATERNATVRARILQDFEYLGAILDSEQNEALGNRSGSIHAPHSRVSLYVFHTEEIAEIARIANALRS